MTLVSKTYCIDISKNPDLSQLKSTWLNLEAKNNQLSFFHSWQWLETWLHTYNPEVLLVSAKYEGKTVALGLFGKSQEIRHHIIKSNQIRLFQTGNQQEDQIWVEFNDFLCHPDHLEEASKACLNALFSNKYRCDEIVISMILKSRAESLLKNFNHTRISLSTPAYKTNLQLLSANKGRYLDSLSRNTRYQINHSRKKYETLYGTLKLSFARNITQALQYWDEAGELHIRRWHDSGFQNPKFVSFHKEYMVKNFDSGVIDLVKITAGNHLVAIIYNIIYKHNVYFYLQGLQYETDGKLKPGLLAHSMLIEHYLQQGMNSYEFMGGYSQYKKQLSQAAENLLIIKIQKPLLKFRLESIVRNIKQKIL
jgi:CelD/BcsL family acetyltransferase involved in cellulose biosynthesis